MTETRCNGITYTPPEYIQLLEDINLQRKNELSDLIGEHVGPLPEDVSVVMVGSDGKLERHPQSLTELVLVSDTYYPDLQTEFLAALTPFQQSHSIEFDYNNIPGYYFLRQEAPFAYQYQNPHYVFPGFIFNSTLVHGSEETRIKARQKVLEEMNAENDLGRRIHKHMRNQLKDYRRAMNKGGTSHQTYFDLDSQTVFYNDHEKILGFKGSFIRGIQRATGIHMTHLAKVYPDLIPELAQQFPASTMKRIHALVEYDQISPSLGTQTIAAYNWFLQRHHEVQELFKQNGKTHMASCVFDKNEFSIYQQAALEYTYSI